MGLRSARLKLPKVHNRFVSPESAVITSRAWPRRTNYCRTWPSYRRPPPGTAALSIFPGRRGGHCSRAVALGQLMPLMFRSPLAAADHQRRGSLAHQLIVCNNRAEQDCVYPLFLRSMSRKQHRYRLTGNRDHRQRDQPASQSSDRGGVQRGATCPDGLSPLPLFGARRRYPVPAVCGLLLLAVGLVFGQTVGYEFVNYDDHEYVYENPQVSRGLTRRGDRLGVHAIAMARTGIR